MGWYEDKVLPRLVDKMLSGRPFDRLRAETAAGLTGTVVEIGFGSGLNVPHYPDTVDRVFAVDPATLGRDLAAPRLAASTVDVEFVGLDGEHLPLEDRSVDAALCTFTLCTVPHAEVALRELHRVLKPGGQFHFLEHGLHPDAGVARWQHRLEGLQRAVAGGCQLTREIDALVRANGFELAPIEHPPLKGPKTHSYLYRGVATAV